VPSGLAVPQFISLRRFRGTSRIATAWAVLIAWVVYLGVCSSQGLGHFDQAGHVHSAASQAILHHDDLGDAHTDSDASEDPECCAVPQDISAPSLKHKRADTAIHFISAPAPLSFAVSSPGSHQLNHAAPVLSRTPLITPLWPNAPPAIMDFSREGRVTAG